MSQQEAARLCGRAGAATCHTRGVSLVLMLASMLCVTNQASPMCNKAKQKQCESRFKHCIRFEGPAMDKNQTLCRCNEILYGDCLRRAGCAMDTMRRCIDTILSVGCYDMTVCGNNCASDGQVPHDAILLPVNNFGGNYLKFAFCNYTALDLNYLKKFSTVRITKCVQGAYTECPLWVPPHTFTALAIPRDTFFLDMHRCNVHEDSNGNVTSSCLADYKEYHGQPNLWPSSIDVDFATAPQCMSDLDCPGSFCDKHFEPPLCSPKVAWQLTGHASSFYDPPFGAVG